MANIIQRPNINNPPAIDAYNYPMQRLNPKAKENIFVGNKMFAINDYSQHKNLAIAAIAISGILFFGGALSFGMSSFLVGKILTYGGLTLGSLAATYFVFIKFLNPHAKIEFQRERFRFMPLAKVLEKSLEDIEGYDLLKRAIEDKSLDPKEKTKTYICLRQLKRNLEAVELRKRQYETNVNGEFHRIGRDLRIYKDEQTRRIYANRDVPRQVTEADIREVERLYSEHLNAWQNWQRQSLNRINEQFINSNNDLEGQYRGLLGNLGKRSWLYRGAAFGGRGAMAVGGLGWRALRGGAGWVAGRFA